MPRVQPRVSWRILLYHLDNVVNSCGTIQICQGAILCIRAQQQDFIRGSLHRQKSLWVAERGTVSILVARLLLVGGHRALYQRFQHCNNTLNADSMLSENTES